MRTAPRVRHAHNCVRKEGNIRTTVYAKKATSICTDTNSQNLQNSIRQSSLSRYSVNAFCRESNSTEYCVNDSSPHGQHVETITDSFRGRHKAQSEAVQTQGDAAAKGAFSVEWLSSMTGPQRTLCSLSFHPAMFVQCLGREISLKNSHQFCSFETRQMLIIFLQTRQM